MKRGENIYTVTLVPFFDPTEKRALIGVVTDHDYASIGALSALKTGAEEIYGYVTSVFSIPVRILQGTAAPEEGRLVGYRGMYEIYTRIQRLWFFAIISISLGVMNLLPIPALDGGRILLTLPEILIRRRIPTRFENAIHLIGFAFLLILLIYINVQDFINPVQLP